jgi:hypothetical protein
LVFSKGTNRNRARSVSNITENALAATGISNDILFENINAMERVKQHSKELVRINVSNAKTIANRAAEFAVNRQTINE